MSYDMTKEWVCEFQASLKIFLTPKQLNQVIEMLIF